MGAVGAGSEGERSERAAREPLCERAGEVRVEGGMYNVMGERWRVRAVDPSAEREQRRAARAAATAQREASYSEARGSASGSGPP